MGFRLVRELSASPVLDLQQLLDAGCFSFCEAHNLKVTGSNPLPATHFSAQIAEPQRDLGFSLEKCSGPCHSHAFPCSAKKRQKSGCKMDAFFGNASFQ
jgi:hypothetical protein